jgi:hypothetical protein
VASTNRTDNCLAGPESLRMTTREMVGRIRGLVLRSSLVQKIKSTPIVVLLDVVPNAVCSE